MKTVMVENGVCFSITTDEIKVATCYGEAVENVEVVPIPTKYPRKREFFRLLANRTLRAATEDAQWVVAGWPGPVSADGSLVGPLVNMHGMTQHRSYDVERILAEHEPRLRPYFEEDNSFALVSVNDGELAAHAAASLVGKDEYARVAALIIDAGIGAGMVMRDPGYECVFRADKVNPLEMGHLPQFGNFFKTTETAISLTGQQHTYKGVALGDVPQALTQEVSSRIVDMTAILGFVLRAGLVVPYGRGFDRYADQIMPLVEAQLKDVANPTQQGLVPDVMTVPEQYQDRFPLYGAVPLMRDVMSRPPGWYREHAALLLL